MRDYKQSSRFLYRDKETITEYEDENGNRHKYNACREGVSLARAKMNYPTFTHVYSGYVYWVDGVRNESKHIHHFFV